MESPVYCTGLCRFKVPVPAGWPEYARIGDAIIIPVADYRNITGLAEMEGLEYRTGFGCFKVPVPIRWPEYTHIGNAIIIPVTRYRNITGLSEICLLYTSPSPRDGL